MVYFNWHDEQLGPWIHWRELFLFPGGKYMKIHHFGNLWMFSFGYPGYPLQKRRDVGGSTPQVELRTKHGGRSFRLEMLAAAGYPVLRRSSGWVGIHWRRTAEKQGEPQEVVYR